MDENTGSTVDPKTLEIDPLPDGLRDGSTVLVASTDGPATYAVCLRILCRYGTASDTVCVVTTTESADRTIETYTGLEEPTDQPSLRIVDTTSEQQSVSALYGETPVVFTPSSGDIERLVLALSELSDNSSLSNGTRHFVIRSLTPVLESAPTSHVCSVLERITGLRSETGLCLVGLEYTAHDEETIQAVATHVDGILWVTHPSPDRLDFEYQPTGGRYGRSEIGESTDS